MIEFAEFYRFAEECQLDMEDQVSFLLLYISTYKDPKRFFAFLKQERMSLLDVDLVVNEVPISDKPSTTQVPEISW